VTTHLDQVQTFCAGQRWFGAKGRAGRVASLPASSWLSADGAWPAVRIGYVHCVFEDGGTSVYQLPLSYREEPDESLAHAYVGEWAEPDLGGRAVWVYDALHDKEATPYWLDAITNGRRTEDLEFHPVHAPGDSTVVPEDSPSLVLSVEQSNTSLVYGDTALLKVFRRLEPGPNPGVEVESALTEAGSDLVPEVLGWVRGTWPAPGDDGPVTGDLAMLTVFQRSATDGWTYATTSVRDLYAEGDLHADEVGGDFAGESYRLGITSATVHADLAKALGTDEWPAERLPAIAATMRDRLSAAVVAVPQLGAYATGLAAAFDDLASYDRPLPVQRIHGDFHLGQTLRTIDGWKVIDFEGEPVKTLAERRERDTTIKDVAGMLRSFDYAARQLLAADHQGDQQIAYRAAEWSNRNRAAFCEGYAEVAGADPRDDDVLLRAFIADKVVYEVLYEARNRPTWLPIPLGAAAQLSE
jgi:maltokinase